MSIAGGEIAQIVKQLQQVHDMLNTIADTLTDMVHGVKDEQDEHFEHHNNSKGVTLDPLRNALEDAAYNITSGMEHIERAAVELNYYK